MAVQPFTPDGVLAKQAELYALTDQDLLDKAQQCSGDLNAFLNDNFTFTTDQSDYLGNMTDRAAFAIGCQLAAVLTIKGSITMDAVPTQGSGPKRPKQTNPHMTGSITYVDGPSSSLTGDLSVHISWLLL